MDVLYISTDKLTDGFTDRLAFKTERKIKTDIDRDKHTDWRRDTQLETYRQIVNERLRKDLSSHSAEVKLKREEMG